MRTRDESAARSRGDVANTVEGSARPAFTTRDDLDTVIGELYERVRFVIRDENPAVRVDGHVDRILELVRRKEGRSKGGDAKS